MAEYESRYTMDTDNIDAVRYQAKEEVDYKKMCEQFDYSAFVTHFDTLHGLDQLPGLAAQNMMQTVTVSVLRVTGKLLLWTL